MNILLDLISIGLIVTMFVVTSLHYPYLPERVPIHFGITGRPDNWGPKWMIWLMPVLSLVLCGVLVGVTFAAAGPSGMKTWLELLRVEMLALFWVITRDQIRVALGIQGRLSHLVWVMLAVVALTSFTLPHR
jgi:uncharacterized membrane protein